MLLLGRVAEGFGLARYNLSALSELLRERTGLRFLVPGTLNLRLDQPYRLEPDSTLTRDECNGWEALSLQRCCIGGLRAYIIRPESHDAGEGHGQAYLEILAEDHLRHVLALQDGDAVVVAVGEDAACWRRSDPAAAAKGARRRRRAAPRKLILRNFQSPGDIVTLTAAVRDLHRCYPGRFLTDVRTSCPDLWQHNPYVTPLDENERGVEVIECHYPLIHRSNQTPHHFLHGFVAYLNDQLGLQIAVTEFRGDIHISDEEKRWFSEVEALKGDCPPFWLLTSGGKRDFTIKWWDAGRYQQVVDHFRGRIEFVQVGERDHVHPPLEGVIDLRGATTLRQLVRLMYHAEGALSAVSLLMHLAAAVDVKPGMPRNRPCVVVAGGREPPQWSSYPHHQFIHTVGALRCCDNGGCWKSRTLPLGDGDEKDRPENLCVDVVGTLPRCMDMITADEVIRRIEWYYRGGALR